ncbi:hypothetical protein FEZ21_08180 [Pseudomonas sp. 9.1(2019)]|nr:hypothetical protein [Pseudomonas sp. 9.1(2019)]
MSCARSAQGLFAPCLNGGSWLASDAGDAVFLRKRSRAIAGKPAPTGYWALSGMDHFRYQCAAPARSEGFLPHV